MNALKEYEKYCEYETEQFRRVSIPDGFLNRADIEKTKNYTLQRMLGASFYAQGLELEFEDIDEIYEKWKSKVLEIYEKCEIE